MDPRWGYFMRVFGQHWAAPGRMPSMLDLSRDASPMALAFARLGFRVTSLRLADGGLEDLGERLERLEERYDIVCCYDVLEHLDDWRNVLDRIARRLRPGGLLMYSVEARAGRTPRWLRAVTRWLRGPVDPSGSVRENRSPTAGEVHAAFRRVRLLSRETVTLDGDGRWWARPATAPAGAGTFAGFAVRESEGSPAVARIRWDFQGTGERWLVGRAAVAASLVARLGAQ
jgi:SAM-dependent methyltransferase